MSKISGSEAVIKCLLEEGVDIIYGYPGGAIMPVYDELYKYQDKIQHVLTSRRRPCRRRDRCSPQRCCRRQEASHEHVKSTHAHAH